ncbi:MAG: carboxypeptidase-like regulatory domain-containing protein, partial [Vicinamibacterales bacterium]
MISSGNGQYQIIDLRPGVYSMTFTLPGFSTVKRDGIELAGSFTATVNAELRVGSLEETITVTGDSPIVDVQSVGQQQVLGKDVIDNIPSSRTHFSLAAMIPAMNTSNSSDIGGTNSISLVFLTAHGGRSADQRVMIDGLSTHNAEGAGQYSGYLPNTGSTQEIAIDYAGGGAEMQGSNYDQDLKNRGLTTPNEIRKLWDVNPGGGGPVVRDKVWWYGAYRWNGEDNYAGGFFNKNAGIKDIWTYEPDPTKRTANWHEQKSLNARVTWQRPPVSLYGFLDPYVDLSGDEPAALRGGRLLPPGALEEYQQHLGGGRRSASIARRSTSPSSTWGQRCSFQIATFPSRSSTGWTGRTSRPDSVRSTTCSATARRPWNDSFYPVGDPRRGNYVPDCDLRSPLGNEECG